MHRKDCSQPLYIQRTRKKSKRSEREARGGEGCMPSEANQTNRETVDIVKKVVILASSSCYRLVNNSSASWLINRAAMGRARFLIYPWFINRAAMDRARFLIYPWFIFFFRHVGQAEPNFSRPKFQLRNLCCLLTTLEFSPCFSRIFAFFCILSSKKKL